MLSPKLNKCMFMAFAVCAFLLEGNAAANALLSQEKSELADDNTQWEAIRNRLDLLESKIQASKESPSAFNPSLTVFGNVMSCFSPARSKGAASAAHAEHHHEESGHDHDAHDHGHDHDSHEHEEGHDHAHSVHGVGHAHAHKQTENTSASEDSLACPNTLWIREIELDFRASIDPYADGVVILAFHQESPGEFHVDVEEAYVVLKPGFQLKLGRFKSAFGRINRIHLHDLPQMTAPLAFTNFLGSEGYGPEGASAQFLLPTPGDSNALTLELETLFGSALPLGDTDNKFPKFVGRLSWFFDLSNGHDIDVGTSALVQPRDLGKQPFQLYGADFNYRWRPYVLGDKKSFLLGGEMFVANQAAKSYHDALPIGGFAWTQLQFNQNTYLGLRYSLDQGVTEKARFNTSAGVFLTYYTTEFLRIRAGYDRVSNDIAFKEGRDLFMVELNFIFGSHPTEPYWVNR